MCARRIFNDIHPSPGIYLICCRATGDTYVGLARMVSTRLADHRRKMVTQRHSVERMNTLTALYGMESFEFSVLEYCDEALLEDREWHWMIRLSPTLNPKLPDATTEERRWKQPWLSRTPDRQKEINDKRRKTRALRRVEKQRNSP